MFQTLRSDFMQFPSIEWKIVEVLNRVRDSGLRPYQSPHLQQPLSSFLGPRDVRRCQMHLFPGVAVFRHSLYHAPSVDYIYIYIIYIVIYICLHECVFSKMDQNDAVAIYKKSYHELSLFGEAPVCSSTIIGSEAYVLPGLTNSPVGPSPDSVAQRVAAESWVAHMVCCGWYLCASLQTAVPSLGRG